MQGAIEPLHRLFEFGFIDDQRRQEAHHIVAGADREQFLLTQRIDQIARRHHRLDADQQALAAALRRALSDSDRPPRPASV